jgi:hypothetical protein
MKAALLAMLVLVATPRLARADGWWEACDQNSDGSCDGCDSDGDPTNGTQCKCSGSKSDPTAVGFGLGLMGIVAWRIGKKRRTR